MESIDLTTRPERWRDYPIWEGFDRSKTVCFSGHRPEKLPGGTKGNTLQRMLRGFLHTRILTAIDQGYTTFLNGTARGVDLWAGEIIMALKLQDPRLHLISVKPMEKPPLGLIGEELYLYNSVLECSDLVICTQPPGTTSAKQCFQRRNQFMVDHASLLIAMLGHDKSGTGQTVRYAKKQELQVEVIDVNRFLDRF